MLSKNCCTVPFSMVSANKGILNPRYYITTETKERLKNIFLNTRLVRLDEVVQKILTTGTLEDQKVCPDFIAALKKLPKRSQKFFVMTTLTMKDKAMSDTDMMSPEYLAQQEKRKREYELKKYPSLKTLFEGKLKGVEGIKEPILKRIHIVLDYLRVTHNTHNETPTLEEALAILGKAHASLMLIEEIGPLINKRIGGFIAVFPREAVQLRDLLRAQVKLGEDLVRAITFEKIKREGTYGQKPQPESGTPVSD